MITFTTGNLFDSQADCLVNTVNCEGHMGKGLAYQFKRRFPENNRAYEKYCQEGKLRPGIVLPYKENNITIINFPTKDKWRDPSLYEYIENGLDAFINVLHSVDVKRIAIPPLGCGNGGLNWSDVKQIIEEKLNNLQHDFIVYEPVKSDDFEIKVSQMTAEDLMLLYIRPRINNINSLRFQKTVYFAQYYLGKEIFRFGRGKYGPYSKALYLEAEKIGKFQKQHGYTDSISTFDAIYQIICSRKIDTRYSELKAVSNKAVKLVNDISEDIELEGIATVLYLILDENLKGEDKIVSSFRDWSDDKRDRFDEVSIRSFISKLEDYCIIQRNLFNEFELL